VQVICPSCEFPNIFWGICDDDGHLVEHYGRRCQGLIEDAIGTDVKEHQCNYRFVFKECPHCGGENDIAARNCLQCKEVLVDPDDMLKKALQLKDAKVIRCSGISLEEADSKGTLKITYHDEEGAELSESFDFSKPNQVKAFNNVFAKRLSARMSVKLGTTTKFEVSSLEQVLKIDSLTIKAITEKPMS
jgi:DNA repair protein RadD